MILDIWKRLERSSVVDEELIWTQNVVVDVVAGLSTLGSAWIILNFIVSSSIELMIVS